MTSFYRVAEKSTAAAATNTESFKIMFEHFTDQSYISIKQQLQRLREIRSSSALTFVTRVW